MKHQIDNKGEFSLHSSLVLLLIGRKPSALEPKRPTATVT